MFTLTNHVLAIIHFLALSFLALYGLHRLWLVWWWKKERQKPVSDVQTSNNPLPTVTVQLPFYNERFVAARLIDTVAAFDWPKDRLEIQVLDDSTDDTLDIIHERVEYWKRNGFNIHILHRDNRSGYKAGALARGLQTATGEFIAIFDADFLPQADFLQKTIGHFDNREVGMVQARWGFLNAEHSWLTRVQAMLLGPHFSIEHFVRCQRGLFFNFNGTAGVWRRQAIEEAGGWQADTVTEDLDLSYRAQLAGWRFVYLEEVVAPSELPVTLSAFRTQQQRWAKGSIQTAKKILPQVLTSSHSIEVKIEATIHLLANFGWLLGALVTLTLYPTICWRTEIGPYQMLRLDFPLFMGATAAILFYYMVHAWIQKDQRTFLWFPLLPVLTLGLAPSLALAVLKGLFSQGGIFNRTPKFGLTGRQYLPELASLYKQKTNPYVALNLTLLTYSLCPVIFSFNRGTWYAIPFLLIFTAGFFLVFWYDFREMAMGFGAQRYGNVR